MAKVRVSILDIEIEIDDGETGYNELLDVCTSYALAILNEPKYPNPPSDEQDDGEDGGLSPGKDHDIGVGGMIQ